MVAEPVDSKSPADNENENCPQFQFPVCSSRLISSVGKDSGMCNPCQRILGQVEEGIFAEFAAAATVEETEEKRVLVVV